MGNSNRISCHQYGRIVWLTESGELVADKSQAKVFEDLKSARAKQAELLARPDVDSTEIEIGSVVDSQPKPPETAAAATTAADTAGFIVA